VNLVGGRVLLLRVKGRDEMIDKKTSQTPRKTIFLALEETRGGGQEQTGKGEDPNVYGGHTTLASESCLGV